MIEITQIRGKKQVIRKMNEIFNRFSSKTQNALAKASLHLRDKAIENLEQSAAGGWAASMGLGRSADSIRDKSNWEVIVESPLEVRLRCKSRHAAVVEWGGLKYRGGVATALVERAPPAPPFPIGKQQGLHPPLFRYSFTIQPGYNYTTRAMQDDNVKGRMLRIIRSECRPYLE